MYVAEPLNLNQTKLLLKMKNLSASFHLKACLLLLLGFLVIGCSQPAPSSSVQSPAGNLRLEVFLTAKGEPAYRLTAGTRIVTDTSRLGLLLEGLPLQEGFRIASAEQTTFDETWKPVWGQFAQIRNHYNQLSVAFSGAKEEKMTVVFRLYNDGLGFRYELPQQAGLTQATVLDELTEFNMGGDHDVWWIPGCWDNDEYHYTISKLSQVDATNILNNYKNSHATTITKVHSMNTPATMRTAEGLHISLHEAALVNFPGMSLEVFPQKLGIKSHLAATSENAPKASIPLPFSTPWRTIQVAGSAGELITSSLILNLNEPSVIEDVSWIKPMKYAGIWWEMHVGKSSWAYEGGKHGATTQNAKAYIDFCAANGIPGLLIEGWNTGWERWTGEDREGVFDFTTPYPDFDLPEVVRYAKEKGVAIIGHHETAAAIKTYESRMDTAFKLYQSLGIHAVKTGYVGKIAGHTHYEQRMVNHYNQVMEQAARHQISIDVHEPIKPTGLSRTYPNMMSAEGMRGQEFNAWSDGNPPTHLLILPFARNLAGPMDYTPGIFDIKLYKYKNKPPKSASDPQPESYVKSTLAAQLAMYVVYYSPLQMVADLPENYEGHPAFQFIREVAVDWDDTKVLNGEVAEYVTIARKAKGADAWFIGAMTNETARQVEAPLDFLSGRYVATIYADAADAHWDNNPTAYQISRYLVDQNTRLKISLAAGGGVAISLMPATEADQDVPAYQ